MILLNPGPVVLTDRVRAALGRPDVCHRQAEFVALQTRVRDGLRGIYGFDGRVWAPVLLPGSGTAAVEAMLTSLVPDDGVLLTIENGAYGERMARIAGLHRIPVRRVQFPWGAAIDPDIVLAALDAEPRATHVAVVHHETATGRLNDLDDIAAVCQLRQARLLVDGVSSFAAERIDPYLGVLDGVAGTAGKCLHAAAGLSFAMVRRAALATGANRPRSLYLDLFTWCREQDRGSTPYTQPPQLFFALDEALAELRDQGGWTERHAGYARLAAQVRTGLAELGVEPLLPDGVSSVALRAYHAPAPFTTDEVHDKLRAHGFLVYPGRGADSQEVFRISTMGDVDEHDVKRFLGAFATVLGADTPAPRIVAAPKRAAC